MLLQPRVYEASRRTTRCSGREQNNKNKEAANQIGFFSFAFSRPRAPDKLHLENVHALLVALRLLPRLVVDPADAGVAAHAEHVPHNVLARRHVARLGLGRPDVDEPPKEVGSAVGAAETLERIKRLAEKAPAC